MDIGPLQMGTIITMIAIFENGCQRVLA